MMIMMMMMIVNSKKLRILILLCVVLIASTAATVSDDSSSKNSSPLVTTTRHLRTFDEDAAAIAFPQVYTAIVPPPVSDDDFSVHFIAQVDLLDVKKMSADSVQVTLLVHGAEELVFLKQTLAEHDDATSIHLQLDVKQTNYFQKEALVNDDNLFLGRQQPTYPSIDGYSCYKSLQGSFNWMNDMVVKAESIPDLSVTLTDIGDSYLKSANPNEGYDMVAMKITGMAIPTTTTTPKAIMFAMSGIHAREYSPPEMLMRWAEQLMDAYGNDADLSSMLDHTEIHLVIQSNPDGRAVAEVNRSLYRRKNLNPGRFADICGDGDFGVDLNRNFPTQWGFGSGSSANECSQTYRGTAPASEPEVRAIVDYCGSIFPEGQRITNSQQGYDESSTMGIFFDIHSFGEFMIWPWGYKELETGNDSQFEALGSKYRNFNGYDYSAPFNGYLYPASGVTDDWAYSTLGAAAMTFELGNAFYQSCAYFESSIVDRNIKALNYAAKVAMAPYSLPKGPDVTSISLSVSDGLLTVNAEASDSALSATNHPSSRQQVTEIRFFINEHPSDTDFLGTLLGFFGGVTIDVSSLADGRHVVYVQAMDEDGYKGPVTAEYFEFTATVSDTPAPTISMATTDFPEAAPTPSPAGNFACFSGETTVVVKGKGLTTMKDLKIGDHVLTSVTAEESYQLVYSFGHRTTKIPGEYMQLLPSMLEISPDHMVFLEGKGAVPATVIQVGDRLADGMPVTDIRMVNRTGMYAPFTTSGTVVVNGVLASSYIAFHDSPMLMIGPVSTGLSYQWLAHTFQLPHRIYCYHLGICEKEHYTATGISEWASRPLQIMVWFLSQHLMLQCLLLIPLLTMASLLAFVETVIHFPGTIFALICISAPKLWTTKSI